MNVHAALGLLAGFFQLIPAVPYIKDILYGTTRPNIVSFGIWFVLGLIEVSAQWSAGASWSIIIPIVVVFNTALVIGLGVAGYGYKKYTWFDTLCLCLALGALVLWYVTSNPVTALLLTMAASTFAAVPTFIKTYKEPESELAVAWLLVSVASIFAIFSSTLWNTANLIIPVFNLIEGAVITSLAFFGQRFKGGAYNA